jgi:hypothetical protein
MGDSNGPEIIPNQTLEDRLSLMGEQLSFKIALLNGKHFPEKLLAIEVNALHALHEIADPNIKLQRTEHKLKHLDILLETWHGPSGYIAGDMDRHELQANVCKKLDEKMSKQSLHPFRKLRDNDMRFDLPTRSNVDVKRKRDTSVKSNRADTKELFSFCVHFLRHCVDHNIHHVLSVTHLELQWSQYYPGHKICARVIGAGLVYPDGQSNGARTTSAQRFTLDDILTTAKEAWPDSFKDKDKVKLLFCMKSRERVRKAVAAREEKGLHAQCPAGAAKLPNAVEAGGGGGAAAVAQKAASRPPTPPPPCGAAGEAAEAEAKAAAEAEAALQSPPAVASAAEAGAKAAAAEILGNALCAEVIVTDGLFLLASSAYA